MAKKKQIAVCVGCGCTDDKGCPGDPVTGYSCTWIEVDYKAEVGVCCRCVSRENVLKYNGAIEDHKMKYPVKKVHGYINKLQNRREFLSTERRREGRVEL